MDKLSRSVDMHSSSKRVKLLQKFSNNRHTIKYASAPTNLRSAMKKRQDEYQRTREPRLAGLGKEIDGFRWQSKDCTKKHKTVKDKYENSKQFVTTKEEEEAAEALFSLAQTFKDNCYNKTSQGATKETERANGKVSQKRCLIHVYICCFIKDLQTTKSEQLVKDNRSKEEACVNAINSNPQQCLGCYENLQNQRQDTMDLVSGSCNEIIGSKHTQVPGSKQCLFLVGSGPLLELSL